MTYPNPMIDARAAARLATQRRVVWLDCRFSLADYSAGRRAWRRARIPGAQHLDMEIDLSGRKTGSNGRHPLPSAADMTRSLRRAGAKASDTLVLYDDNMAGAARAWWLSVFFGLTDVRVLDGGLAAWRSAGFPIDTRPSQAVSEGDISLTNGDSDLIVTVDALARHVRRGDACLVDAREAVRYRGEQEPIDPVPGRIPGAINLPWTTALLHGRMRSATAQRRRWRHIPSTVTPIMYCGSGVTASVNLLSMAIAGRPLGQLYAGSYSEWVADSSRRIARDSAVA